MRQRPAANNSMNSNEGGFGCVEGGDPQEEEGELTRLVKKAISKGFSVFK